MFDLDLLYMDGVMLDDLCLMLLYLCIYECVFVFVLLVDVVL